MKSYARFAVFLLIFLTSIVAPAYVLLTGDVSAIPLVKLGVIATITASSVGFISFMAMRSMSSSSITNARAAYVMACEIVSTPSWVASVAVARMIVQAAMLLALGFIGLSAVVMVALVLCVLTSGFAAMYVRSADLGGLKVKFGRTDSFRKL